MKCFAGFFTLFIALQSAFGYSATSGAAAGASAGAGSFSSTGGSNSAGVFSTGSGSVPSNSFSNTPNAGQYGSQYPYVDNNLGSSYGGSAGGSTFGGSTDGSSYGGAAAGAASGGAYAGTGAAPFIPPVQPPTGQFPGQFPSPPSQYDYQNLFLNFWKSLSDNYANAATMTFATPGANAFAAASSGPHNELINEQLAHQAALFNQINAAGSRFGAQPGVGASGGGGGGYYAPSFASSSASLGPQGGYQTANIIPANPNSPNVDTRYGGENPVVTTSVGQPGFYGVSSSSFSTSSDINGQKSSHREAQTTINDNGQVTTYTVRS
ncbi:fibroin heavy chain isoform X1 [Phlebotomus argentipes]|uniref:fibroin heavy chain isoform X1 n=1 Tax=Phlebotomus argentipes TaxID=94469 RepID=UPI002892F48A|nr:fibroin heavy chain isoform X1 [Phlebotomus argentipes]